MTAQSSVHATSEEEKAKLAEVSRLERAAAVDTLMARLSEPSWVVRRAVVAALARNGSAVTPLCAVLESERTDEARLAAAAEALWESVGDADEAVLPLLREPYAPAVVCDAAHILGRRRCTRAVPALARLTAGVDDNVAISAIEALGRIGGDGAVEALIAAVLSRKFFRSFPAIAPLGRSSDPRATAPVVALLQEPPYAAEAAEALGHSPHLAAVPPLALLLSDPDDALVRVAAGALARLRSIHGARFDEAFANATAAPGFAAAARARLRGCFEKGRASEKISVSVVLGWLHDDAAVGELLDLVRAEAVEVGSASEARAALVTLGSHAEPRLLQALRDGNSDERLRFMPLAQPTHAGLSVFVACLGDPEPRVRAHACRALARIGDVAVIPALFGLIGDENASVSQAAVTAIGLLDCAEAKAMSVAAASAVEPPRRRAGLRLVARFGIGEALDAVITAISDPLDRIRDTAIGALPSLDGPRALAALVTASSSPSQGTRAASMRAFGHSKHRAEAAVALRRGIRDDDGWVRYYACQALGTQVLVEALTDVIALVDDPAGQVRVAAIEAIAKLGGQQATAVLDGACRSNDPDIRRAAILGLGACRQSESLPILLRESASEDSTTRLYALSALAESDSDEATEALVRGASDPASLVRSAAAAILAVRAGPRATQWLIAQLGDARSRDHALTALEQPVGGRIEGILTALESADSSLTPVLVGALSAMDSAEGQAALEATLAMGNIHARRSGARALAASNTSDARIVIDRIKLTDPDGEVRRICAAAAR